MELYREDARNIPVYGTYDVIVVGGGCAGFAAAAASARLGGKTIILEQFPYFGGTATASLMANIVGIRNQVEPNNLQVCKGIGEELILELLKNNGAEVTKNAYLSRPRSDTKGDLSYSYAFDTEVFKRVTMKMIRDSGCDVLFHVYFSDVIQENDCVKGVIVESKSGRLAIYGKVVIDATGDGDVAARSGAEFWQTKGNENKRLNDALMYKVSGFNPNVTVESCVFGDTMVLWGPNAGGHNGVDAKELTEMEMDTRERVYDHFENLKKDHPELWQARIVDTGSLLGIRQTRFVKGVYTITGDDVLNGAEFEDSIAMGANPVINYYGYRRFLEHEGYEIPYRCLIPEVKDGLLVAGRCMSSDQIAFESWRAMAHVLCIGEAAGTAACMSAKESVQPRNMDIKCLQRQLISQGAEIGQGKRPYEGLV